jgi:hypothetical protein
MCGVTICGRRGEPGEQRARHGRYDARQPTRSHPLQAGPSQAGGRRIHSAHSPGPSILQSTEFSRGTPELAFLFIGGVHISARARHVLNLIWFGYIARLSLWGVLVQILYTCLRYTAGTEKRVGILCSILVLIHSLLDGSGYQCCVSGSEQARSV